MAAPATQNPQVKSESKSAKKKKAAKVAAPDAEPSTAPVPEQPTNGPTESNSGDGSYESPYIKELYKNIRNINKKIANASKVDGIVAENSDKTLDQLIAERKINADQKAQILKKPGLTQQLQQYEEQIAHFKKFDQEYKAASQAEKAAFEKTHTDRSSKKLEEAVASAKAEGATTASEAQESNLLLLSQFLRLAAIRRGEDEDPDLEENKALEGLLGRVYTGDAAAVSSMLSLINGSDEKIHSVNGDPLTVTFADIKRIALAQAPPSTLESAAEPSEEPTAVADYPVQSDPTIANAGLTEIDEPSATAAPVNGTSAPHEVEGIPPNSGFGGEGGANAAAQQNWDNQNDLSTSQEWVEVPRDAAETDTGITATPAAPANVQSWADDQPESPEQTAVAPPANEDDGFQNVPQRSRGRGDRGQGGGQYRGNRGRGEYRGRGRGEGRGRGGRGGPRGGGAPRRGGEES